MARFLTGLEEAASIIRNAERILVFGCAGSGKSTLAQALSKRFALNYVSMDRDIFWLPGWQLRPRPEALARMQEFVAQPRWIIDGNSPGTLPLRLARADIALWPRPSRYVSLLGVVKRWWRFRGRTRPEMAPGCPERLSREFLRYIWNFERDEVPQFMEVLAAHGKNVPVLTLKSYREGEELLALLKLEH